MSIGFTVAGREVGLGWIIALLVLIACFVCWLMGGVTPLMLLALIAALAVAYLIG